MLIIDYLGDGQWSLSSLGNQAVRCINASVRALVEVAEAGSEQYLLSELATEVCTVENPHAIRLENQARIEEERASLEEQCDGHDSHSA